MYECTKECTDTMNERMDMSTSTVQIAIDCTKSEDHKGEHKHEPTMHKCYGEECGVCAIRTCNMELIYVAVWVPKDE